MRFGSVCSGVGCIDLGLERAGFDPAWQVEIDPRRRQVLARHWPNVQRYEDLKDVAKRATELPPVDLLCGGTPCQSWSVAGPRDGLAGDRSQLFYSFIRLADLAAIPWILWENVPGVLSQRAGEDFAVLLEGFTGARPAVPAGGWRSAGVAFGPLRWCVWRILDARYFGVPQRRRRIFVVAGPRAQPRPEILLESAGVQGPTPASSEEGSKAACLTGGGAKRGRHYDDNETLISYNNSQITHPENRTRCRPSSSTPPLVATSDVELVYSRLGQVAPTLTAGHDDSTAGNSCDPGVCILGPSGVRILTPLERERLQGLPDYWTKWAASGAEISWTQRRAMTGDGASVPVLEWIGRRLRTAMEANKTATVQDASGSR